MLTLRDAINRGKMADFIAQEEARGIGPADRKKLDAAIKKLTTTPLKSKGRTSHSSCDDGSTEK
jgi:hypothetical protein